MINRLTFSEILQNVCTHDEGIEIASQNALITYLCDKKLTEISDGVIDFTQLQIKATAMHFKTEAFKLVLNKGLCCD